MKKTVARSNSCRDTRDKNEIKKMYRTRSYDSENNSVYKKIMDVNVMNLSSEEIDLDPDKKTVEFDQWYNLNQNNNNTYAKEKKIHGPNNQIDKKNFGRKNSDNVLETLKIIGLKKKLKCEKQKIKMEKEKLKKEKELLMQEKIELEKEKEFISKYWRLITKNN
jgi:hypothetical protein